MKEIEDHEIQSTKTPYDIDMPYFDLKVIDFSLESFNWNDYIGKYHINFICSKGTAHFSSSNVFYQVSSSDYVAWSIDMEISEVWFSEDFEGKILITARNFLIEHNPQSLWSTKGYLLIKSSPVIHLSKTDFELIRRDLDAIASRQSATHHIFSKEILGKYLQIYLLDLWDICKSEITQNERMNRNSASIFTRFLELVQQNALTRRDVLFYAHELCVTSKYLSEVSRAASGKSALYWIHGYAVQEIIALMKKPQLTIAEIADKCQFYNPSHFSRFFKKFLGITPTAYRLKLENQELENS